MPPSSTVHVLVSCLPCIPVVLTNGRLSHGEVRRDCSLRFLRGMLYPLRVLQVLGCSCVDHRELCMGFGVRFGDQQVVVVSNVCAFEIVQLSSGYFLRRSRSRYLMSAATGKAEGKNISANPSLPYHVTKETSQARVVLMQERIPESGTKGRYFAQPRRTLHRLTTFGFSCIDPSLADVS